MSVGLITVTYYDDDTPDAGRRKESIQLLSTGNLVTSYQYDATGAVRYVTDPRSNTIARANGVRLWEGEKGVKGEKVDMGWSGWR